MHMREFLSLMKLVSCKFLVFCIKRKSFYGWMDELMMAVCATFKHNTK